MIQTQLIKAATQATPADSGILLPGLTQEGTEPLQGDSKAAFADAMALAQQVDKGAIATPVSDDALTALAPDAKSLAAVEEATPSTQHKADKAKASETDLPPDDFLQQLQASLRQDTSLTLPAAAPVTQALPVTTDGNDLPPESQVLTDASKPAPTQGAAGREAAAQQALSQQMGEGSNTKGSGQPDKAIVRSEPGKGAQVISASATPASASPQAISQPMGEVVAADADKSADPAPASPKPVTPPLSGEERAALLAKVITSPPAAEPERTGAQEPATNGTGTQTPHVVQAGAAKTFGEGLAKVITSPPAAEPERTGAQVTDTSQKQGASEPAVKGTGAQTPHAVQAGAAKTLGEGLAKVITTPPAAEPEHTGTQATDTSQKQGASEPAVNGAGAHTPHTVQAGAAKAFGEGLVKVETDVTGSVDASTNTATEGDNKPRTAAQEQEAKPAQSAGANKPDASAGASGSHSAAPVVKAAEPDPVMAAPQQVLARHESQGPQAPLTALSAGIQQMEAEPAVAVRAAAELKQPDLKPKLGEQGKQAVLETKAAEQSETAASVQSAQTQVSDSKPTAEVAARRDAQNLPHLKLATPEAPTQLHQKVNLMLADKLQQAEIQLDPLGLGKMKIQIQMGADSQANVHFVVQHGQTREMLEQAMPRLRDMLAGQGIQLGQTQVQQQGQPSQQQPQGQSAFNGQEQRGQQGSGSFGGNGQGEGEHATRTLSLLVESTNDAGIDFYA